MSNSIAVENLSAGDVFTIDTAFSRYIDDTMLNVPITVIETRASVDSDNDHYTVVSYSGIERTSMYLRHGAIVELVSVAGSTDTAARITTAAALAVGDVFTVSDAFNESPLFMPTQPGERLTVTQNDHSNRHGGREIHFTFGAGQSSSRSFDNEHPVTVYPVQEWEQELLAAAAPAPVTIGQLMSDNTNGDRLVRLIGSDRPSGYGPYVLTRLRDYSETRVRAVLASPTTGDVRSVSFDSQEWEALPEDERASANEATLAGKLADYYMTANDHRRAAQRSQADFETVNEFMNALADHTSWCGEYEQHMETLNGKLSTFQFVGRETEHEVDVTLTLTFTGRVTVNAHSESDAVETVQGSYDASDIANALGVYEAYRAAQSAEWETD
jgi:hypothetical protein